MGAYPEQYNRLLLGCRTLMDNTAWVKILLCVLCSFGAKKGKFMCSFTFKLSLNLTL